MIQFIVPFASLEVDQVSYEARLRTLGSSFRSPLPFGSLSASGSMSSSSSSANLQRIRAQAHALRAENRALKARVSFAT